MNSCINSFFAIVVHIVLCCINLLPVTTMMLVSGFILRVSLLYPVYYEISDQDTENVPEIDV